MHTSEICSKYNTWCQTVTVGSNKDSLTEDAQRCWILMIVFLFLSNTFRVKRSPKKSPMSDPSEVHFNSSYLYCLPVFLPLPSDSITTTSFVFQDPTPADETPSLHQQDDHATDEEKLASSTSHKWAALHGMDADLNSDQQDFPQPCDLTSFVNENSLPHQAPGEA